MQLENTDRNAIRSGPFFQHTHPSPRFLPSTSYVLSRTRPPIVRPYIPQGVREGVVPALLLWTKSFDCNGNHQCQEHVDEPLVPPVSRREERCSTSKDLGEAPANCVDQCDRDNHDQKPRFKRAHLLFTREFRQVMSSRRVQEQGRSFRRRVEHAGRVVRQNLHSHRKIN
jgi:hypothetical protein